MDKGLIFTYVVTYGGALVSLYKPYVGLLIYVCFALSSFDFAISDHMLEACPEELAQFQHENVR